MNRFRVFMKKDGWLLLALVICAALCLLMGGMPADSEEARISRVLSAMEGAGAVDVALHYDSSIPCGAVIIAEGADSIAVRLQLSSAVSALLGLDESRIAVYQRKGGE